MNPTPPNKFGQGRFSRETEDLYHQFQKRYRIPEPIAMLIAHRVACEAGNLAKNYFGRPSIRYLATHEPTSTYAMAVVKACAHEEESSNNGISTETQFELPELLQKWMATIISALTLNDSGALARKKSAARVKACPGCGNWELDGQVDHVPNCSAEAWKQVNENQKHQPSQRQQENLKVNTAIAISKKKAKLGPSIIPPAPKKSKSHSYSNWPPIVSGGAVETNRRKF